MNNAGGWKRIMATVIFFALVTAAASAQDTGDDQIALLKEQVEILKKQVQNYEERGVRMEERLKMIEQVLVAKDVPSAGAAGKEAAAKAPALSAKEGAVPAVEKISEKTTLDLLKKISTESAMDSRDVLFKSPDYFPNYITKGLEFHGYFRSGYGVNSKGGKMQAFQAPDALAKYRLGNEQETYIETVFLNRNWNPDPEGVTLETQIRVAYQTQQNQTWDLNDQIILREMFGRMGHFVSWDPGIKVWAGQRFLRLPELDINDFWWYDLSGYGGGFEDINVGIGTLDVTFVGFADNDINLSTSRGRISKENLNFKLNNVDVPFGKGMFWVNGGFVKGGTWSDDPRIKYPDMAGVDIGFMHYMPGELNNNQFGVQFGCGANTSLSAGANIPTDGDDRNSWRVRITNMFNRQFTKDLSMQAVGVYQYTDYGHATKNTETWLSLGARPVYMFTKHFGVEVEPGMDYINNPRDGFNACLYKLTGGIRITPGPIFNSRPAFRLFATYAKWNDGFKGNPLLGGDGFLGVTEGMNYGIQCENWW